jgi:hypothetical protein
MKTLAAFAALSLLGACATAAADPVTPPPGTPKEGCDVTASFGSYAMGIDREAFGRVETWLAKNPALVAEVATTTWGREGERTLCITATSPKAITPLFKGVMTQLPTIGKQAPITLLSRKGGHFHTKAPR